MENREKIIEGAAELFRIYGIKAVTMDTLSAHLGMSKRTIYEVFSDKDELLIGVLRSMAEKQKLLSRKVLAESDNAIAAIFKLIEMSLAHISEMSPAFIADMKKFHFEVLIKKTEQCEMPDYRDSVEFIERGIKEKLFRKDINADIVNRCLDSLAKLTLNTELYPLEKFIRRDVIRNVMINYLKGIATPEGLELINKHEKKL